MSAAPQELENSASKYASSAIRFDSQGVRGMAITNYQNAINTLEKLQKLYPRSKLNPIYKERCQSYRNRIDLLRGSTPVEAAVDGTSSPDEQAQAIKRQEDNDFDALIMHEKPQISWHDVIGLDDAKRALRESIIYPTKRPDLFPLGWPKGLLLYGPPGTGKTMLAAATANKLDGYFIVVDASSMMSKWLGEAEKNVSKMFKIARKYASHNHKPVVLFVDEVDSLLGTRNSEVGGEVRTKNQFLTEMDGVNSKGENTMLYVIGATNKPWTLDWPFLRRFQKRIYVALPSREACEALFRQYTEDLHKDSSVKPQNLARLFNGYSASDIRDVCQGAQLTTVHELFESPNYRDPVEGEDLQKPRKITIRDFQNIRKRRKPSVSVDMVGSYHRWSEEFGAL